MRRKCELVLLCDLLKSLCEHSGSLGTGEGVVMVREPLFLCPEGNSSCLTKSLHPHWANLYALFFSSCFWPRKCVNASHFICFWCCGSLRVNAHPYLEAFFSRVECCITPATHSASAHCARPSRGLITCSLKVQPPPMSETEYKSQTVIRGKICVFFLLFFSSLATQHKDMTNKSNKLFIVSWLEASPHTDRNGIYANKLAVNAFYLKLEI